MLYLWQPETQPILLPDSDFEKYLSIPENILWLDLHDSPLELKNHLAKLDFLHPLTIEKIFAHEPRAFLAEFDQYLHLLFHELYYSNLYEVSLVDCNFILGKNFLITIHQEPIKFFDNFLAEPPPARFFKNGADLLFYYLAEPLLSSGFQVLDEIADLTENIEDRILPHPEKELLNELFDLKKDLMQLRKTLVPMREILAQLARRENSFMDEAALPFMGHLYDTIIRLSESCDLQRDLVSGALELYLSSISNRTNEVMMTLTVVSTLILPLTLIVGYYGMNFRCFPETNWKYGIPFVVGLMCAISGTMLWYFKKRKWF